MVRGLYTSSWGMITNAKQMDVVTNNLSNINTNAFKKDIVVFETFPSVLTQRINDTKSALNPSGKVGNMQLGSDFGEIYTYYNQGLLVNTSNNSDFAIDGCNNALFSVGVPDKDGNMKEYYTRDGTFTINANKQLVTKQGDLVLGEKGPITLASLSDVTVEDDGTISQSGNTIDKLKIMTVDDTRSLRKSGNNLVYIEGESKNQPFTGTIRQGFIEQSNVNTINEMLSLINVMRSYEANQKVLQQHDNILGKAVNEVGVVK